MTRTLSLVDCIKLEFSGSVLKNGLCFGDVDNDGLNEFVVGNSEGNLSVYRNDKCICTAVDLGEISCIAIGDLLNIERNFLVVISTDGVCHVFDVEKEIQMQQTSGGKTTGKIPSTSASVTTTSSGNTSSPIPGPSQPHFLAPEYVITPFHTQRIPPNVKTIHLGDVNCDGLVEMIVGLTDRVLRTYQWKVETNETNIAVISPDGSTIRAYYENPIYEGSLVALNKWEFPSQICSTALHQKNESTLSVLVAHPGGNVTEIAEVLQHKLTAEEEQQLVEMNSSARIDSTKLRERTVSGYTSSTLSSVSTSTPSGVPRHEKYLNSSTAGTSNNEMPTRIIIKHHDLYPKDQVHVRINNFMTSEIIGNVKSMEDANDADDCYAVSTLDGTVVIARQDSVVRQHQMNQQIFALAKFNGMLLMCAWSGETYLIDSKETIEFSFGEPALTFTAGKYGVNSEFDCTDSKLVSQFCVAYVSFNDKVYIYCIESFIR